MDELSKSVGILALSGEDNMAEEKVVFKWEMNSKKMPMINRDHLKVMWDKREIMVMINQDLILKTLRIKKIRIQNLIEEEVEDLEGIEVAVVVVEKKEDLIEIMINTIKMKTQPKMIVGQKAPINGKIISANLKINGMINK